jgi:hypothetical protein
MFRLKSYSAKERNDAKRMVFHEIRLYRETCKMRNFVSYYFTKQKTFKISFCISSNNFAGSGSVSVVLRIRIRILLAMMFRLQFWIRIIMKSRIRIRKRLYPIACRRCLFTQLLTEKVEFSWFFLENTDFKWLTWSCSGLWIKHDLVN